MDKFINMTNIFPDYIKIDVDGAEESIISGMTETVQNEKLRSVVIEVSDKSEPAISNFFHKAGFRIEFERTFNNRWEQVIKISYLPENKSQEPLNTVTRNNLI